MAKMMIVKKWKARPELCCAQGISGWAPQTYCTIKGAKEEMMIRVCHVEMKDLISRVRIRGHGVEANGGSFDNGEFAAPSTSLHDLKFLVKYADLGVD